jgi:PKD repeat protein
MARAFFAVWLGICTLAAAGDAASLAPAAENGPSPPLLDCRGSESLPLGGEVLGSTRVHPSRVEHYEVSFDPNETFSGPEAVLFFTNPEVQDIKISLETEGDLSLFLLKDCDERRVVSYGDRRLMLLSLPPGEYYVVVDGRSVEGADFYLKTETGFATTEAGCIQSTPSSLVACPPASAEQPGVVPLYARIVAPEQGAAGGEIHFTDESIGGAKMWTWNFGDETVDVFERNPSHVFQEPGAYVVSLTVSDGQGNASTQYRLVRIEAGPAAGPLAASAAWGEPPEFLGGIATSGGAFTCPSFAGTQFWFARYTELPTFSDPAVEASQPSGLVLINPDVKTAQYVITGPYTASGTIAPQGYESLAFPGDPSGVIVMGEEDTVINKGFQLDVLNDVPILAYYIVPRSINYTQDSYQLIPVQTLGTEYVAANYEEGMGYLPNAAIILASEDATTVTVAHPTCGTRSFTFNRGDVYAYTCNGDLTGALVTSNKPVTVINWRKCTYVGNSCCCDRLIDPALPTNFWDTEYFVSPLPTSSNADAPSRVRVVAKDDNTQVFVNGVLAATLAAGEFYQTQSTQPLHITASQPVQVYQFAMSQSFTGTGDPFMLMAIPNTFYRNNSAFFSYFIYDNFVNIVAPEAATASVLIDGVPPTAAWQTFPDGAPYRWMRLDFVRARGRRLLPPHRRFFVRLSALPRAEHLVYGRLRYGGRPPHRMELGFRRRRGSFDASEPLAHLRLARHVFRNAYRIDGLRSQPPRDEDRPRGRHSHGRFCEQLAPVSGRGHLFYGHLDERPGRMVLGLRRRRRNLDRTESVLHLHPRGQLCRHAPCEKRLRHERGVSGDGHGERHAGRGFHGARVFLRRFARGVRGRLVHLRDSRDAHRNAYRP